MEVLVATHGSSLKHDTGEGHPERPERVEAVHRGVVGSGLEVIEIQAPQIQPSEGTKRNCFRYRCDSRVIQAEFRARGIKV